MSLSSLHLTLFLWIACVVNEPTSTGGGDNREHDEEDDEIYFRREFNSMVRSLFLPHGPENTLDSMAGTLASDPACYSITHICVFYSQYRGRRWSARYRTERGRLGPRGQVRLNVDA